MTSKIILSITTGFFFLTTIALGAVLLFNPGESTDGYKKLHDYYANSQEILGQTLTVEGYYSNSLFQSDGTIAEPEEGETIYHFLTVLDKTECCDMSIEFVSVDSTYPDTGDYITVTGVFTSYEEDGHTYYTLKDATYTIE